VERAGRDAGNFLDLWVGHTPCSGVVKCTGDKPSEADPVCG